MDPLVGGLLNYGLPGLVVAILVYLYVTDRRDYRELIAKKDKELADERAARIADAKAYNELALRLQQQVLDAVNKLVDVFDEIRKPQKRYPDR